MTRPFTGWHMTGVLVGMFGLVIAVNFIMARYAVSTFGGVVVENSYVASQEYNHWLAEARAQKALGWTVDATLRPDRRLRIGTHTPAGPLSAAMVSAVATHPLGRAPEQAFGFTRTAAGDYLSDRPVPAGRWLIRIGVRAEGHQAFFDDEVPA